MKSGVKNNDIEMLLMTVFSFQMSSVISFVLTILNILVICCIICVGIFHVDRKNWTDPPGFFPFGFRGVCKQKSCICNGFIYVLSWKMQKYVTIMSYGWTIGMFMKSYFSINMWRSSSYMYHCNSFWTDGIYENVHGDL